MVVLYALTMFIGATLLFVVQPMVAKLLLPSLGGSAAVWTTCMLFFQVMLLAGYGYAHLTARYLAPRRLVTVHLPLMMLAALVLPFGVPHIGIDPSASPTIWLLSVLLIAVGLPFFIVSTTAPLLQHLFAQSDHRDAADPYFLYGASNLGSTVALIGYPTIVEPWLGVGAQSVGWALFYGCFVLLMVACARTVFDQRQPVARTPDDRVAPLSWRQRARWIILAAAPSSLMLGVTQHITTDVAPVPLLWVLPLALYLGTFVLVFARRPILLPEQSRTILPIGALVVFAAVRQVDGVGAVALHLVNFFLFALFFHGTLSRERPHVARLTEYFLLLSVGGVLGGVLNALVAPLLLDRLIEYHVVMIAAVACIAVEDIHTRRWPRAAIIAFAAVVYLWSFGIITRLQWYLFGVYFAAVCLAVALRPRWQNAVIAGVLAIGCWAQFYDFGLHDRSFFASYLIYERDQEQGTFRYLRHGTTVHGVQATDPVAARIARSYHHPSGPAGEVIETLKPASMLVIGLGVGAMAAYAGERTTIDFFEIDPLVHHLASTQFTYLSTCGDQCTVAIGDGRRLLADSSRRYDLIMLDAYNSSSVPAHLLTREALQLYLDRLTPDGALLFNVSNNHIEVGEVVGAACADAALPAYERTYFPPWELADREAIDTSQFIVAARNPDVLAPFGSQPDVWRSPPATPDVWTDDYTNVLSVIRW